MRYCSGKHACHPSVWNLTVLHQVVPNLEDVFRRVVTPDEIGTEMRYAKMVELSDFAAEAEGLSVDNDTLAVVVDGKQVTVIKCIQLHGMEIADGFARAEAFEGGVDADVGNGKRRILIDDDVGDRGECA